MLQHIRDHVRLTPLQILERSVVRYGIPGPIAKELFGSYAEFLKLLNSKTDRKALEKLRSEDSRTDRTFKRVRKVSEAFEHALDYIFFENEQVAPLARKYGLF